MCVDLSQWSLQGLALRFIKVLSLLNGVLSKSESTDAMARNSALSMAGKPAPVDRTPYHWSRSFRLLVFRMQRMEQDPVPMTKCMPHNTATLLHGQIASLSRLEIGGLPPMACASHHRHFGVTWLRSLCFGSVYRIRSIIYSDSHDLGLFEVLPACELIYSKVLLEGAAGDTSSRCA